MAHYWYIITILVQCKLFYLLIYNIFQAAWIVDDSDADDSDSEGEGEGESEDDSMVVDDHENGLPDLKHKNDFEFDEDQASLNLRDSDDETETESVMMEVFATNF